MIHHGTATSWTISGNQKNKWCKDGGVKIFLIYFWLQASSNWAEFLIGMYQVLLQFIESKKWDTTFRSSALPEKSASKRGLRTPLRTCCPANMGQQNTRHPPIKVLPWRRHGRLEVTSPVFGQPWSRRTSTFESFRTFTSWNQRLQVVFLGFSINPSRKCFSKGQCFLFFVVQQFFGPWFMFAKSHLLKVPRSICHPGNTATRGFFVQPRHEMRHNFSKSWRLVHVCLVCLLWKNQDILTRTGRVSTYQLPSMCTECGINIYVCICIYMYIYYINLCIDRV